MTQESVTFQAFKWEVDDGEEGVTIHIHGLTQENKRVAVKIPDFKPYVYLELDPKIKWTESKLELLRAFLRKSLHDNFPVKNKLISRKKNYYYKPGQFLWMAFNNNAGIRALERAVRNNFTLYGVGNIKLKVHEQRANPVLQLFAMRKVKPAGWIIAKRTKKQNLLNEYCDVFSTADIEMVSSFSDVSAASDISHVCNPLIASYDIECVSGDKTGNTFPNPTRISDEIICISATVALLQDEESKWRTYALVNETKDKKCPAELEDEAEVRHFKNEKELLLGWSDFINEIDPDVIIGYNTLSFDDHYMCERANTRLCWPRFSKMGRLLGQRSKTEERKWSSSAYGDQVFNFIDIPGRLHIDMYPVIFKDFQNLMSYTLDFVSEYFLGDHKLDLPAKEMIQIWHRGEEEDIRKIVTYCNKDTYLPLKLMQKMNTWLGLTEMANVVMVPVFDLVTRGQQIRVFSQVYCLSFELGVVTTDRWADYHPTDAEKEFVGATVQNPLSGYWEKVPTFDFRALYPTTIIAYNLCFSTFVTEDEHPPAEQYHDLRWHEHVSCEHDTAVRKTKVKKLICREHHYRFYKSEVKKGIIPMLLENLLDARANARKKQAQLIAQLKSGGLSDEEIKNVQLHVDVLEKRQLGYKISANSMYGGYGSDFSYTPFYPAAAATTAMGRKSIQDAIDFAKAYRPDTVVVYGDSVTGDTPVLLREPSGGVVVKQISLLAETQRWDEYGDFKPSFTEPISSSIEYHVAEDGGYALMAARHMFNSGTRWSKERKELHGWQVWTDSGWSDVRQIIRHQTSKQIFRVTTHTGAVDVTQDHSLLTSNGREVKPINVREGDRLLHSYPATLENNSNVKHFLSYSSKLDAANVWYDLKSRGYRVYLMSQNNRFLLYNDGKVRKPNQVTSVQRIGPANGYVYDLETETGRFQAGVGELIVKNTDSCMLHFSKIKSLKECFEVSENLEKEINAIFPKPMYLELEKIYSKYFLLSKKRYVGYIVDKNGDLLTVDKKGVVIKRRDNCGYLRDIYSQLIDMVMAKEPQWKMYEYLRVKIDDLLNGNVELEKLVITKSIKDNYKAQNLPHVAVAKKMRERGKYVASGTRVQYIFTVTGNSKDPQYIKAEDPDHYLKNMDTVKIDYLYYFEKQLVNPIDEVLEVKFGIKDVLKNLLRLLKKGAVKNATQYFRPKFRIEN